MESCKAAWMITKQNLAEWRRNDRILVVFGLALLLLVVYVGGLPRYALANGEKNTPFLLALLFTGSINANGSLKVLLLFGMVVLFCNAPFLTEQKLFLLLRSKREGWWMGEALYVILGTFLYMSFLLLVSIVMLLPCASFQNEWGNSIMMSILGGSEASSHIFKGIKPPPAVLFHGYPWQTAAYAFFAGWLVMTVLGLLIYCVNLYSGKSWIGVALAVFLIVLDPVLIYTQTIYNTFDLLLSPASWISVENLRQYSGHGYLTVGYVMGMSLCLIGVLLYLIRRKSKKMDILLAEG